MLYTEPRLGVVVLLIAIPQLFVVPMIQRRINVHVRERSHTLVRAGDLMVEPELGHRSSAGSLGSEIGKAFETIYRARLTVFKLKFGLKFLISALQSTALCCCLPAGSWYSTEKPKLGSWWPSSAGSIASSNLGVR